MRCRFVYPYSAKLSRNTISKFSTSDPSLVSLLSANIRLNSCLWNLFIMSMKYICCLTLLALIASGMAQIVAIISFTIAIDGKECELWMWNVYT